MTWLDYKLKYHIDPSKKRAVFEDPNQAPLVTCQECGRQLVRITTTHLRVCSGLSVADYRAKHPEALVSATAYERSLSIEERHKRRAEYKLRWQRENPQNFKRAMDKWVKANPDKLNARSRDWKARNADKIKQKTKRIHLRLNFGLTIEQYEIMLNAQEGLCAICRQPETSKGFVYLGVDHCHRTGTIRGLLCNKCNLALGLMQDSPELLRVAALYLDQYNAIEVEALESTTS